MNFNLFKNANLTTLCHCIMQRACYHPGILSHRHFQGRSPSGTWCRTLPPPRASSPASEIAALWLFYWETQPHSERGKTAFNIKRAACSLFHCLTFLLTNIYKTKHFPYTWCYHTFRTLSISTTCMTAKFRLLNLFWAPLCLGEYWINP